MPLFDLCPACGSADIARDLAASRSACWTCGYQGTSGTAATSASSSADAPDPSDLPTWLAVPWAAWLTEADPRLRLLVLLDGVEMSLRWTAALAIAELVHAGGGSVAESLEARLRDHIERPTLGRWLAIIREVSACRPRETAVFPGVFGLHGEAFLPRMRTAHAGGDSRTSLLVARNEVAHGGVVGPSLARDLLVDLGPLFQGLIESVASTAHGVDIVATLGEETFRLLGVRATPVRRPEALRDPPDGTWAICDDQVLDLWPLTHFGPVLRPGPAGELQSMAGGPVVQIYCRSAPERLSFTPMSTEMATCDHPDPGRFQTLFGLNRRSGRKADAPTFRWDGFLAEARQDAAELVGRAAELQELKSWLKGRDPWSSDGARVAWLHGGPGIGKSMLVARLASDYSGGGHRGLYLHRFRQGDERCSLRWFCRLLLEALDAWEPLSSVVEATGPTPMDEHGLVEAAIERLGALPSIPVSNPLAPRPAFWVLVDGVDELGAAAARFPELVDRLALPGTVWLVAGRPQESLAVAAQTLGWAEPFPESLPDMAPDDLRTILEQQLGPGRRSLWTRDRIDEDAVRNPFMDRLVECADGLPLYVRHVLAELQAGRLTVYDEAKLPAGLAAAYDEALTRAGLGTTQRDLALVLCLLAEAKAPLETEALASLLSPSFTADSSHRRRASQALRVGGGFLRSRTDRHGESGWALRHHSFREHLGGAGGTEEAAGSSLEGTVNEAGRLFFECAKRWRELPPDGALGRHILRWGTRYALAQDGGDVAAGWLADLDYLVRRLESLASGEVSDLLDEMAAVSEGRPRDHWTATRLASWERFFRGHAHTLRRGSAQWPASRILLQVAADAGSDRIRRQVTAWHERNGRPWWSFEVRQPWLQPTAPAVVFEGHSARVWAVEIIDERLLATTAGDEIRTWDVQTGACDRVLEGHAEPIRGLRQLPLGRLVSWDVGGGGVPLERKGGRVSWSGSNLRGGTPLGLRTRPRDRRDLPVHDGAGHAYRNHRL